MQDVYDVKLPCHLLLARLAAVSPPTVVAALDRLVPALHKTLKAPVKTDAVKQEVCTAVPPPPPAPLCAPPLRYRTTAG